MIYLIFILAGLFLLYSMETRAEIEKYKIRARTAYIRGYKRGAATERELMQCIHTTEK